MDSKSLIIHECEDFSLRLEYTPEEAFIHLPFIKKLNKTIISKLQDRVVELLDFLLDLGYNRLWAVMESENLIIKRLTHLIGFEYVEDYNGYSIYRMGE